MIYFFADDHYDAFPGRNIYENLPEEWKKKIVFQENDWTGLQSGSWVDDCDLLILHLIGATCNLPHPDSNGEKAVKAWCERGGNILLLHGASAAFWQWEWWRKLPGCRWVRPNDPDGVAPSTHPTAPYKVTLTKARHPLSSLLAEMDLPKDEIYTELENVNYCIYLMETIVNGKSFVQCCETLTPWGGKMVNFTPGHNKEVTGSPVYIRNIITLMEYLLKGTNHETL